MQQNKIILYVLMAIISLTALLVIGYNLYYKKYINIEKVKTEIQNSKVSQEKNLNTEIPPSRTVKLKVDVWADNWFAFYLGDKLVKEDSVSIDTEKSFNKESFTFEATYPLQFNFIVKDYKANDTGLEYIGTGKQQMGDGGFIAQFTDIETGEIIAVTDSGWKTKVIHTAPLDAACKIKQNPEAGVEPCTYLIASEPVNWKGLGFDDTTWSKANIFSEAEVRPKDGYSQINWNKEARFIWSPDLYKDNTILMRLKLEEKINTIKNID